MQKGILYDRNQMDLLPGELWLPITEYVVPDVNPYYYISTKGRIWSTCIGINGGLMSTNLTTNGYVSITLSRRNRTNTPVSVHRIEMLTFAWIPGCEFLDVNHKDGVKTNNDITNLEWSTHSENLIHAYDTGLKLKGELHPMANHTEYQVRKICEGLTQKLPFRECAIIAGMEPSETNIKFISDIKSGIAWQYISIEYNIPKGRNNQLFSDDEIHQICKLMQLGLNDGEIIKQIRPELNESKYKNVMYTIRHRKRFNRISDNYNF